MIELVDKSSSNIVNNYMGMTARTMLQTSLNLTVKAEMSQKTLFFGCDLNCKANKVGNVILTVSIKGVENE